MAKQYYDRNEIVFAEKPVIGKDCSRFNDLTGKRFGRLTILGFAGRDGLKKKSFWFCLCDCSKITRNQTNHLVSGRSMSCGCLRREITATTMTKHGMRHSPEYSVWCGMKKRCENPSEECYPLYGGRGIELRLTFEEFFKEVGSRPNDKMTIERIDTNGHYEKGNLKWASSTEQANNRRNNKSLTVDGCTKTYAEWEKFAKVSQGAIWHRVNSGWCDQHAVFSPKYDKKPNDCPECNKF